MDCIDGGTTRIVAKNVFSINHGMLTFNRIDIFHVLFGINSMVVSVILDGIDRTKNRYVRIGKKIDWYVRIGK